MRLIPWRHFSELCAYVGGYRAATLTDMFAPRSMRSSLLANGLPVYAPRFVAADAPAMHRAETGRHSARVPGA